MMRRDFIKSAFAGGAGLTFLSCLRGRGRSGLPRRELGKTGERLSVVGFGGVLVMNEEPAAAARMVAEAVDLGVNYFDVAPSYGNAQERLGPALEPFRKNCFLACKTTERSREGSRKDLEESLRVMRTDRFDLYQLHAMTTDEDVEKAFGPGGAMETLVRAREEGLVRHLGFSAHSESAALACMERFAFDTVLFPVNFACWHNGGFGPAVVEAAAARGMGILALKSLAFGPVREGEEKPFPKCWYRPIEDDALSDLAVRFTLSKGVTALIPPGEPGFFRKTVEIAAKNRALSESEEERIRNAAAGVTPLFASNNGQEN
ncbi:MAG: aldo/keto reductase [bacterium]|nr:aldo/keto reductase [bacterium]